MTALRWFFIIAAVFLGLLVIAGAGLWWFVHASHPDYEKEVAFEALDAEVEVLRDERGVAHLKAESAEDLYAAQGFVHAQERLWQMDLQRRVVDGRLSEAFGGDQLETDRFLRRVGLHRVAERMLNHTSAEGRSTLEQYAAGVNAYIEQADRLPFEFRALGLEPEPWDPVDSAGLIALMAYNLGSNWENEATRAALREEVDEALLQEIMPPYEHDTPAKWTSEQAEPTAWLDLLEKNRLDGFQKHLPRLGSNSWAVSPERSATDQALFAVDPHLEIDVPVLWYENRLETDDGMHTYGWSIPGGPGVVIGHNDAIAWGLTNTGNTQDLFFEEVDPDDPHRFRGPDDEWYEAEVIEETIPVDGRDEPESVEVRLTRNGPIIQDDPLLSLRWTAYEVDRSPVDAILRTNRAANWDDFEAAMEHFSAPVQAVTYADTSGRVGFRVVGDVPIRDEASMAFPQPGWNEEGSWEGMIPFDELPSLFDPPQGYVAVANHRVTGDEYPHTIEIDYAPPSRMQRIVEVLEADTDHTLADFEALQTDWTNRHASERLPRFLEALERYEGDWTPLQQNAIDAIRAWSENPVNERSSAGAAIFQTWYYYLMEDVFEPEMEPELYDEFIGGRGYMAYNALEHLLDQDASDWFPDGLDPLLRESFRRAVEVLDDQQDPVPDAWRWDRMQTITFEHVLGESALLGPVVNQGTHPYGGDQMTVGRAAYPLTEPFNVSGVAGVRFVANMGEPIRGRGVIAGGQSGHPWHEHSADQLDPWLQGTYFNLAPSRADVEAGSPRRMTLVPVP